MRPINEIIVHCTATPEGRPVTVDEIRGWHKQRGWADIGYHSVVYLDGSIHPGRPEEKVGAHVEGHNSGTLGIVYVGGVTNDGKMKPKDTRTAAQKAGLLQQLSAWLKKYPNIKLISGHNQYAAKACPCFNAQAEYAPLLTPLGQTVTHAPILPDLSPLGSHGAHSPAAIGRGTVKVKSNLNLRREPDARADIIGPIPNGTPLVIYGQDGGWYNVQTPFGARGWVSREFVRT